MRQAEHFAEVGAAVGLRGVANRRCLALRIRRERESVEIAVVRALNARDRRCNLRRGIGERGGRGAIDRSGLLFLTADADLERAVSDFLQGFERNGKLAAANPSAGSLGDTTCDHKRLRRTLLILHAAEILLSKSRLFGLGSKHGRHIRRRRKGYRGRTGGKNSALREHKAVRFKIATAAANHARRDRNDAGCRQRHMDILQ